MARAQRRRQVLEALEFERARADALREQLEAIVTEAEGPVLDEAVFAHMEPAEVDVVRPVVQVVEPEPALFEEEAWFPDAAPEEPEADPAAALEEEIARLQGEIESSRMSQRAFERYLELLNDAP
jgi:hypothetical protein